MSVRMRTSTYLWVWLALMLLALGTFGLSFAPLGAAGPWIAITIATIKAVLIAAFFMHLVEQPSTSRWAFGFGLMLAALLLGMVYLDVLTRDRPQVRQPGVPVASREWKGTADVQTLQSDAGSEAPEPGERDRSGGQR